MITRRAVLASCVASALDFNEALVEPYSRDLARARGEWAAPFAAMFRRDGRTLVFVAALHTADPNSDTHLLVHRVFETIAFSAVIVEGPPTRAGPTPAQIRAQLEGAGGDAAWGVGESALAARLALGAGVPFWGGEPEQRALNAAALERGFTKQDILAARFIRSVPQLVRAGALTAGDDPRLEAAFARSVSYDARAMDSPPEFSVAEFRAWYRADFGIDLAADPELQRRNTPGDDTKCARIIQLLSHLRDLHLLTVIRDRLEADRTVLVVYGAGHYTTLAPALGDALGQPTML